LPVFDLKATLNFDATPIYIRWNYFRLIFRQILTHLNLRFVNEDQKAYPKQLYYTPISPLCPGSTEAKQKQGGEALLDDAQLSMVHLYRADPRVF
jgi:hypothetical protein